MKVGFSTVLHPELVGVKQFLLKEMVCLTLPKNLNSIALSLTQF